jgi:hypothetical protein
MLVVLTLAPVWTEVLVIAESAEGSVEAADGGSSFPPPPKP